MDLGISGKAAVVFGASKGLGKAIARELAQEGARVAIVARTASAVEATARELGCAGISVDLSQPGAGREAVENAAEVLGQHPDILVTNTGGPRPGRFEEISTQAWHDGFENLWMSTVDSIKAVIPHMRNQGWGRILTIASVAAKEPQPGLIVSNGLRAGLLGMLNTLSQEIAGDGITVNALLPGYMNTDRMADLGVDDATMGPKIPAGRIGAPEEFGALAAFLASTRASYISGQAIAVDGGLLHSI